MKTRFRQTWLLALLAFAVYVLVFIAVHRSYTLRRPAANLAYWYYSDNKYLEAVEFYGFWPLRQLGYHVPGFTARHNDERTSPPIRENL
jgi:hypothetical protein